MNVALPLHERGARSRDNREFKVTILAKTRAVMRFLQYHWQTCFDVLTESVHSSFKGF